LTLASLGKSRVEESGRSGSRTGNGKPGDRENSTFQEDEALPVPFRAKLQDYFRSGYDRGHMYVVASRVPPSSPPSSFVLRNSFLTFSLFSILAM
jgi:endonuclease G, mitochondrial